MGSAPSSSCRARVGEGILGTSNKSRVARVGQSDPGSLRGGIRTCNAGTRVSVTFSSGTFYGSQFAEQIVNIDSAIAGVMQQGTRDMTDRNWSTYGRLASWACCTSAAPTSLTATTARPS